MTNPITSFADLKLDATILASLNHLKFTTPTPIQAGVLPAALEGKDIVGIAQTGTGKTLAFGLPLLQRLNQTVNKGLVVLPTRELALQVDESIRSVGARLGIRTAVLIGGASMFAQLQAIKRNPQIIIATPGRLNDHLAQQTLRLSAVTIVVLDEADRMLDMGFAPQIQKIFKALPPERQTMLFSATMAHEIMKMATQYMKLPIRIEVAPSGTTSERVTQEIYITPKEIKIPLIEKILLEHSGSTLIFTKTKYTAKKLTRVMRALGHTAEELHSNRSLGQRKEALAGFKSGKYRILIATDIASRGIDVTGITLVINFDLPMNTEDYVHRIGRTARAGAAGHAITFAAPDQKNDVRDIERLIRKNLPISPLPANLKQNPVTATFNAPREPRQFNSQQRFKPRQPREYQGSRPSGDRRHFDRRNR